jgi:hypothetical protein
MHNDTNGNTYDLTSKFTMLATLCQEEMHQHGEAWNPT